MRIANNPSSPQSPLNRRLIKSKVYHRLFPLSTLPRSHPRRRIKIRMVQEIEVRLLPLSPPHSSFTLPPLSLALSLPPSLPPHSFLFLVLVLSRGCKLSPTMGHDASHREFCHSNLLWQNFHRGLTHRLNDISCSENVSEIKRFIYNC